MLDGVDAILRSQQLDPFDHLAGRHRFHHLAEAFVLLANDFIQPRHVHAGVLQFRKDAAGFDRLMLPRIADQQNAVLRLECLQKVAHLFAGCEARFIHKEQPRPRILSGLPGLS